MHAAFPFLSLLLAISSQASANSEGDALNALKSNLADPYNVLQSWDPTLVNPCTWYNVTCNIDNSVVRIDLGDAGLSGRLVPQLGQLPNLQYLEMYNNNISGEIPSELGRLKNLVSLDLYRNRLSGPIPDSLGKLHRLRFLRLNNNNLTGHIPMSLTTIKTLQVLYVITPTRQTVFNLAKIRVKLSNQLYGDLSNNQLTGPIPVNGSFGFFTPISFANNPLDPYPPLPSPSPSPSPSP